MKIKWYPTYTAFLLFFCLVCPFGNSSAEVTLSEKSRIKINQFVFSGNTVFSDSRIKEILRPYGKKVISPEELQNAATKITLLYVDNGYINSGAFIPDQKSDNGIVRITIIEGTLGKIEISGNTSLDSDYIRNRIQLKSKNTPLNINHLQKRLKLLKDDRHIKNVHARLSPGSIHGSASLHVKIIEESRLKYGMSVNNHASPGTGSLSVENSFSWLNISGSGNDLCLDTQFTEGLKKISTGYMHPLGSMGTLTLEASGSDSEVISEPFNELDITGKSMLYSITIDRFFMKSVEKQFAAGIKLEYYTSTTYMNGSRFSFSDNAENGKTTISSVKCSQEYIQKSVGQVLALRLTESFGTDLINSTTGHDGTDGKYASLKGQMQYLRRMNFRDSKLNFNLNFQLAADSLPPSERFSAGGIGSVRGYRKNYLDKDQGLEASIELSVPLTRIKLPFVSRKAGDGALSIAPFLDYAKAGNKEEPHTPETIAGTGTGLLWSIREGINAELYLAKALYDKDMQVDYDLQDESIYFRVKAEF